MARTIDNSTVAVTGVNVTQLCGFHDGSVIVPTYDWVSFLDTYFKKLPGVKGYHHFRFSKDRRRSDFFEKLGFQGKIFIKETIIFIPSKVLGS